MTSRRQTRGRHRRPKNTGAPAYLTAATLAAFTVSGMNVPGAIGDSRDARTTPVSSNTDDGAGADTAASPTKAQLLMATELRERVQQEAARATRTRLAREQAVRERAKARAEAARKARIAAERARPKWVMPVQDFRWSAGYGESSSLWSHQHTGQDFAAPSGTSVRAAGDGEIIFAGWDGSYGQKIAVQHADGAVTWYAHLSSFVLTSGYVKAGTVIGRVGSTGNSTGPHLHFEVRPGDGSPVEPVSWLRSHGVDL